MSKPGKILLSGGLILASGAYAWWQQPQKIVAVPVTVRPPTSRPVSPPLPEPAPPPMLAEAAPLPEPKPRTSRTRIAMAAPEKLPAPAEVPPPQAPQPESLQAEQPAPPPAAGSGRYADGDFVGDSVDGEWGPVQVKLVVRNGDIVDAICIVFPIHRQRSAEISEWAIPVLREEVIKTQSEKIDMVSQASFTSEGYQISLASAIMRAHKP